MILKNFSLFKAFVFAIMTPYKYPLLFLQSIFALAAYFVTILFSFYLVGGSISINGSIESIWKRAGLTVAADAPGYIGVLLGIASIVASLYMLAGLTHVALLLVKNKSASIQDIWISPNQFMNYLVVFFAYLGLVIVGTILFIIPGIYFAYKYLFAPIIALDYNYGISKSFEVSRNITFGAKLKLFVSLFILSLLNTIAFIGFRFLLITVFGIYAPVWVLLALILCSWIVLYLALIHIYHQLITVDTQIPCDSAKDYCG